MTDNIRGDYGLAASVPTEGPLDQWAELERLAKAATDGPWFRGHNENGSAQGEMSVWPDARMNGEVIATTGSQMPWEGWFSQPAKDAAFIAAANPSTVLKLIAAARANSVGTQRSEVSSTPQPQPKGEDQ